ncbi:hypothetical protein [Streptomyces chattanoogensis]|uniref:hypothetical protein n=1 Tax=Streptomyces chattanoogensis TaxID=66876 RepID=UPI0005D87C05|nr:hypothetical protein T261_0609 [Streptomyces lydicus]
MRRIVTSTVIAAACLMLAACASTSSGSGAPKQSAAAAKPAATAVPGAPDAEFTLGSETIHPGHHRSAPVPHLAGKGLQAARGAARAAGFRSVRTYDIRGRGRTPASDRGWRVCTQTPGFGRARTDITLTLGVVRSEEDCFGGDE